ncbi:alanine/glycine:cation symporter family protein [Desertihabitans aurantiacus]|uniref:alanine/glycine:cation symporter family protein n=1 Tax=Desertihabitans aurantiacus TaxID=2282477 RepID=UPI000DF7D9A0|nr:alanine/glycine:cation symporter family protein [Desertihabitans aurantiacus]
MNLEEAINSFLDPFSTGFANLVFAEVTLGPISFPVVVAWLVLAAAGFTIYFGFIQFRGAKVAVDVVRGKFSKADDPGEVTHFQALASALSGTVGLGNIAGVGVAVTIGGPGATFWMIVAGLLGMCTKFVECTLGVKYRDIDEDGQVSGGPFKYLPIAFGERKHPALKVVSRVLTGVFAVSILIFGVAGAGMFQSNQTFQQLQSITGGAEDGLLSSTTAKLVVGLIFAGLVALVIIGGIRSIATVTSKLVPAMAIFYVVACLLVLIVNVDQIPGAFASIINGAFNPVGIAGGVVGVMIVGFQRSAFSNEAGIGSAAIAHSAVKTRRPVSEGFVALLEPFIDTVIICTMTALTIIIADTPSYSAAQEAYRTDQTEVGGVTLTSDAFATVLPWFPVLLAIAVALFAFSTILTWSYYGLKAWHHLFGKRRWTDILFRVLLCGFVVIGCLAALSSVVTMADAALFLCAFINIIGLVILLPVVRREMTAYLRDRKAGTLHELGAEDEAELAEIKREHGND